MRCEPPPTPEFEGALEFHLVATASGGHSRRIPIRPSAMRALRNLSGSALHAAFACGIAATLLLVSAAPVDEPSPPLVPDLTASLTPAYLHQYGARNVEETVAVARQRGYEVQLRTSHVPGGRGQEPVMSIRHAGSPVDGLPNRGFRGPLLIVVGLIVGNDSTAAD